MTEQLGYKTFGHGPHAVIALHGWFGDETSYEPCFDALSPDEFTYVFPACRGYGASRNLPGPFTIEQIAADVLALADKLGFERFSLIGHSMGGKAVQRILADAPQRVNRIVAVTPVPASGGGLDEATYGAFEQAVGNPDIASFIVGFSTGDRLARNWVRKIATHPKTAARDEAFSGYLPSWAKGEFHDEIKGHPIPMLVAIGEHDKAINEAAMRGTFLQWYPNAELLIIPNSGHYPMNETPIAFATALEAFLRR